MKRAWGRYITLINGKNFKVKLLFFKTGGQLSMQKHFQRSELWCYLWGCGMMHISDTVAGHTVGRLKGNYDVIECGKWHKFTAFERTCVLEIQYGIKCEEEDILRENI